MSTSSALRALIDFDTALRRNQPDLFLARDCMRLDGHPFNLGAAKQIEKLLGMIAEMKRAILPDGTHGEAFNDLWRRYTLGGELFSDSSDNEKREFAAQLTFDHPEVPGAKLSCPWHAKVNSPKIRIHFSYPILRNQPLYVVYIGLKLTRH